MTAKRKFLLVLATTALLATGCTHSSISAQPSDGPPDTSTEASTDEETPEEPAVEAAASDVDLALFFDDAIVGEPTVEECTLSDGSTTDCYTITVPGTPVNHDTGPFCPTSITDDADAGGLWLDGENMYELDGEFFTKLAEIYGDEEWEKIYNEDGSINVIDTAEAFQNAARPNVAEEYFYNCVDAKIEWLEGGEQPAHTVQIPVAPMLATEPTVQFETGAHSNLGVTLNGALLSGSAEIDAILNSYTIAAFDDCGGHINPALGYHVHGTTGCSDSDEVEVPEGETATFAYALDGFTIHAPYDDADEVELDECNGHTSEEYGYHYHASPVQENATLTCLRGLAVENTGGQPAGPPGGNDDAEQRGPRPQNAPAETGAE